MDFKNFITIVKEETERRVEGVKVKVNETMKNNGILLTGLTILEQGTNISPTIYLDDYYEAYHNGKIEIEEIVEEILQIYSKNKVSHEIDVQFFTDFQMVKDKIIYKLVNIDMNEELLKDVPYIPFENLALIFQCLVSHEEMGNATILIHNVHLKLWNKTVDEIYQYAKVNTQHFYPYEIKNMRDVLRENLCFAGEDNCDLDVKMALTDSIPMYVLSNKERIHGATALVYQDILKDFATAVGKNLYILPSSVHEVILLPQEGSENIEDMKLMVQEINETQLRTEEILSNNIYYYSVQEDQIMVL